MAAAFRGGRRSGWSHLLPLMPGIGRRAPQEGGVGSHLPLPGIGRRTSLVGGVCPLPPRFGGTAPASSSARIPFLLQKGQQKALPFGRRGILAEEQKFVIKEQLSNRHGICNLPRVAHGIRGLKQRYMRVPGYEVYGSQFAMLHLSEQMNIVRKMIETYRRSWPYPAMIALVVGFSSACVWRGYSKHKKNEKTLAEIKVNVKEAEASVKETGDILEELERQISQEEAACKEGKLA